nr:hypothetical protein [Synergistaceae bacterium]
MPNGQEDASPLRHCVTPPLTREARIFLKYLTIIYNKFNFNFNFTNRRRVLVMSLKKYAIILLAAFLLLFCGLNAFAAD